MYAKKCNMYFSDKGLPYEKKTLCAKNYELPSWCRSPVPCETEKEFQRLLSIKVFAFDWKIAKFVCCVHYYSIKVLR